MISFTCSSANAFAENCTIPMQLNNKHNYALSSLSHFLKNT